jgi:malonyl-ACP O-methyltransferase BioC
MKFSSAATYDAAASVQQHCFDTLLNMCSDSTPQRILDLGCGTGTTTFRLAETFPKATITAIDHSSHMIDFANEWNAHPNITYIQADIDSYEPSENVDLIFSNAAFQWLKDPESTQDRYVSFLNPNGSFFMSYFGPKTFRDLRSILDEAGLSTPLASDSFTTFCQEHLEKEDRVTLLFPTFIELLKHIKNTGTKPAESRLFLTPGKARTCESLFKNKYAQVKLTYQALYCKRTRS